MCVLPVFDHDINIANLLTAFFNAVVCDSWWLHMQWNTMIACQQGGGGGGGTYVSVAISYYSAEPIWREWVSNGAMRMIAETLAFMGVMFININTCSHVHTDPYNHI